MARRKLVTRNQVLKSIYIKHLRGIKNLDINFEGSTVTGIFGLNGSGKTTILQTIMCLYRDKGTENTKMSRFFKYTSAANKWTGSEYSAVMDYVNQSLKKHKNEINKTIEYKKPRSEWSPRQAQKPDRDVIFISLSDSIPDIEKISDKKVTFNPVVGAALDAQITTAATQIMGVRYENLVISKIDKIDCYTVKRNGIDCHSLNLGAGEQKIFRILQRLYRAQDYSLLIIDEIDLTIHTAALRELIKVMINEASRPGRNLQIIFTSHRQELMQNPQYNVRFIINTPSKTFCLNNPTEDCYEQLSGNPHKYLKVYVEDDLASAIARKACVECGMNAHTDIVRFGSITNSVRLALGLACQYENLDELDDVVFFGDGDVKEFTNPVEIKKQINNTLAGGDNYLQERRDKVFTMIKHFNPSKNHGIYLHPEEYIHEALISLDERNSLYPEIIRKSKAILNVIDQHEYIGKLLEQGETLIDVVNAFASTQEWNHYVNDLKSWILSRKAVHKPDLANLSITL